MRSRPVELNVGCLFVLAFLVGAWFLIFRGLAAVIR